MENAPENINKNEDLALKEAIDQVQFLRQQAAMRGANDVEIPAMNIIVDQLMNKEIDPEEAVKQAKSILDSKQDYR